MGLPTWANPLAVADLTAASVCTVPPQLTFPEGNARFSMLTVASEPVGEAKETLVSRVEMAKRDRQIISQLSSIS